MQQTAWLMVNPITVGNFAFHFNCTSLGRTSDSRLKDLSIDEIVGAWYYDVVVRPRGLNCWISFALVCTVEFSSHLYVLIFMAWKMIHGWAGELSCRPNIYVSRSTSELRMRLVLRNLFIPFSIFLLVDLVPCFFCGHFLLFVFVFAVRGVCFLQPCDNLFEKG